jgi:hypothetical protein
MSVASDDQVLRELKTEAAKWTMKIFSSRMSAPGAEEIAVRIQMKADAEKWVQDNLKQRLAGKEDIPFPE